MAFFYDFHDDEVLSKVICKSVSLSVIVKMQNICGLIGWNRVHIFDIFNCYRANINGM